MATAPTVQTLDQIMAELQPGYQGQRDVIGKQIANGEEVKKAHYQIKSNRVNKMLHLSFLKSIG